MLKGICIFIAAAVMLTIPTQAQCHITGENYGVGAGSAVVIEAVTGEALFTQNSEEQALIASTTKILTALITLEQQGLDTAFTVDEDAIMVEGSSMGLQVGDTVTLRALAGGMLMASGNDAANAAAVRICGSLPAFAEMMNARALEIGMENSHFVTPSGLDAEGHYSTAMDMALLAREAMKNPDFAFMAGSKNLQLEFGSPPYSRWLYNHTRLLSLYSDAIGIKTGFTKASGRCLVSAACREGVTLICVTLNCPDDWNTHIALYERYFNYISTAYLAPTEPIYIPVTGSETELVELTQASELPLPIIKGFIPEYEYKIYCENFIYAPVNKGDNIARIVYYIDGKAAGESLLTALDAAKCAQTQEQKPWWIFWR